MTTIPTTLRCIRLSLAASLLGGGLLIASAQAGLAAEVAMSPIAAPMSPTDGANQSDPGAAPVPAMPVQYSVPAGQTGFGWG